MVILTVPEHSNIPIHCYRVPAQSCLAFIHDKVLHPDHSAGQIKRTSMQIPWLAHIVCLFDSCGLQVYPSFQFPPSFFLFTLLTTYLNPPLMQSDQ